MTTQLRLIDPTEVDWRLDEQTKAIGRRGLAQARAALRAARAPIPETDEHEDHADAA